MTLDLSPDQREIFAALHRIWDAMSSRDWDRLRAQMAPDFVCIAGGLAERLGVEAFITHMKRDPLGAVTEWELTDPVVQRGPSISVVYAQFRCVSTDADGARRTRHGHLVDVFRHEGERWLWAGNVFEPVDEDH